MNRRSKVFTDLSLGAVIAPALLMMTQAGSATAQNTGADIFQKRCNTCHGPDAAPNIKGPDLKGVFGRSVASQKGYAYSDGLKAKASQKWTAANLDAFLTKPREWAPGTKMAAGTADPTQRAAVIEHLKTYK